MTRLEHIQWCKDRAIQEFDYYIKAKGLTEATRNGITSMMSDINKHPETRSDTLQQLCLMQLMMKPNMDRQTFVDFINGFN